MLGNSAEFPIRNAGIANKNRMVYRERSGLAYFAGLVFIFDIGFKKAAVRRGREEFLVNRFGDVLILVYGTDDEFDLEHVAFMFVPDPLNLTR